MDRPNSKNNWRAVLDHSDAKSALSQIPRHVSRMNLVIGTSLMIRDETVKNVISADNVCCFSYHIEGDGEYINNGTGTATPYEPGMLRLWPPNSPYTRITFRGRFVDKYLHVPGEYYDILRKMTLVDEEKILYKVGLHQHIGEEYDRLTEAASTEPEASLPKIVNQAFTFMTELLLPRPAIEKRWHTVILTAAKALEEDDVQTLSIADLAKANNMGYSNFRRLFAEFFGVPPVTYRVQKKIERIQQTLQRESTPLKQVALRFGYPDLYALSRQFKKYTGRTPSQFRKDGF